MDLRHLVVIEICPDIVKSEKSTLVSQLEYVLKNKSVIMKVGHKWHAKVGNRRFVFSEKPTKDYLLKSMKPTDLKRHVAAVNDLRLKILSISQGFSPFRRVTHRETTPPCKRCGSQDYIDCGTHFTCANPRCAVTRTKYERGIDYRNIKERSQSEGDPNSSNWHTLDPLLSDNANRQTVVGIAAGTAAGAAAGSKPISVRNLNAWNKRMYRDVDEIDRQIIRAKEVIEDVCDDLSLNAVVKRRAFTMFCAFIRSKGDLPRENEVIAACLFEALPPKPKVYPKRKKRPLTPYNDTKQKRLKFMTFKRPASNSI